MLKKLRKAVKGLGSSIKKVVKKPAGAAVAGAMLGSKLGGKTGALLGGASGLGAALKRRKSLKKRFSSSVGESPENQMVKNQSNAVMDDSEDKNLAGTAGTATFKRGGMADKKGRAMKKVGADAMGRAMKAPAKKMMGGGMMRGYKKGGMAKKKGC